MCVVGKGLVCDEMFGHSERKGLYKKKVGANDFEAVFVKRSGQEALLHNVAITIKYNLRASRHGQTTALADPHPPTRPKL